MNDTSTIYFYGKRDSHYGVFSNFYPSILTIDGMKWKTVEHAFQAAKFPDNKKLQLEIQNVNNPYEAKLIGTSRQNKLRPNWDGHKDSIMFRILMAKFTQNIALKEILLSTDSRFLIENAPNDYYWGIGKLGTGKNKLGRLLMKVRSKLRDHAEVKD